MSGRSAKRKGSRVEREIVKLLNDDGIDAHKQPLSGALDGWKGDIKIVLYDPKCPVCEGTGNETSIIEQGSSRRLLGYAQECSACPQKLIAEVKARANGQGFSTLEKWLGANDLLFLKRDRTEPMVAMNYGTFRFLLRK